MFDRNDESRHDDARVPVVLSGEGGSQKPATLDFANGTWALDGGVCMSANFFPINVLAPRPSGDVLVELHANGTFCEV